MIETVYSIGKETLGILSSIFSVVMGIMWLRTIMARRKNRSKGLNKIRIPIMQRTYHIKPKSIERFISLFIAWGIVQWFLPVPTSTFWFVAGLSFNLILGVTSLLSLTVIVAVQSVTPRIEALERRLDAEKETNKDAG